MRQNSDPLPYIQFDRAAKPKVIDVATLISCTPQHAQGSMMNFWELCGDPREIERLLREGKDAVVLPAEEVASRFEIASGKAVDPRRLASIGLLEAQGEGTFRVRGMSRYFDPIRRRISRLSAAQVAGKASAAARKETLGSAQPRSGHRSKVVRTPPERPPNDSRTSFEPSAERSPERPPKTAYSGQRSADIFKEEEAEAEAPPLPLEILPPVVSKPETPPDSAGAPLRPEEKRAPLTYEKPTTPPENWLGPDFFRWAQHVRQINGYVAEKWPRGHALEDWFATAVSTPNVTVGRLKEGFYAYGDDPHWKGRNCPFGGFMSQWASFMPREARHAAR